MELGSWELFIDVWFRRLDLSHQLFRSFVVELREQQHIDTMLDEMHTAEHRAKRLFLAEQRSDLPVPSELLVGQFQLAIDRALLNANALAALHMLEGAHADDMDHSEATA